MYALNVMIRVDKLQSKTTGLILCGFCNPYIKGKKSYCHRCARMSNHVKEKDIMHSKVSKYKKSIYDTVIDSFLNSGYKFAILDIKYKNYTNSNLVTRINERVKKRDLKIKLETINKIIYIEKID